MNKLGEAYHFVAPAKLNLFLHITDRRSDGYHNIQTLLQLIDWYDHIQLEQIAGDEDEIIWQGPFAEQVPQPDNLITRLLSLLRTHHDNYPYLRLMIDKQLPVAAGLGGASSLVASLLLALNQLWSLGKTKQELMVMALELGSDIPFFIWGQTALADGRGEQLQSYPAVCYHYVLVCPSVHCSTAELFAAAELNRSVTKYNLDAGELIEDFWLQPQFHNVFLPLVLDRYPPLQELYNIIEQTASNHLGNRVLLSGSGGTLFVVYKDQHQAQRTYQNLVAKIDDNQAQIKLVQGITHNPVVDRFSI